MTAVAMAYAVGIGLLLAIAGLGFERIAAIARRPRRWIWAGLLAANLGIASMPWWLPPGLVTPVSVSIDVTTTSVGLSTRSTSPTSAMQRLRVEVSQASVVLARWGHVGAWLWVLSSAAAMAVHVVRQVVLFRRRREWEATTIDGVPAFVAESDGPGLVGTLDPRVVVPKWAMALESSQLALILRHERQHMSARDPLLIRLAGMSALLTPWNPASWWMLSRLKLAVEIDCDARVLRRNDASTTTCDVADYAELLLAVATRRSHLPALPAPAMLEPPSSLGKRIIAMTPGQLRFPRIQATCAGAVALAVFALVFTVPVPRVRAQSAPAPTSTPAPKKAPPAPAKTPARLTPARATKAAAPQPAASLKTPAPAPTVAATEVQPEPFGEGAYKPGNGVTFPTVLFSKDPIYTSEAMRAKIQGAVKIEAVIGVDGTVTEARIVRGLGSFDPANGLNDAALAAAKSWRFTPSKRNEVAVPVVIEMILEFRLH